MAYYLCFKDMTWAPRVLAFLRNRRHSWKQACASMKSPSVLSTRHASTEKVYTKSSITDDHPLSFVLFLVLNKCLHRNIYP